MCCMTLLPPLDHTMHAPPPPPKKNCQWLEITKKVLETYPELLADINFCETGQFFQ